MNHRFIRVHLAAQPVHQHVHNVGLRIKTVIEDVLQNHGLGHHAIGMAHEIFQQGKFARLQFNLFAAALHFARQQIQRQVARTVNRVGSAACVARRISAWTRASSSEKANGLVR